MRAIREECYPCLEKLAQKTAELAGGRVEDALDKGNAYLSGNFSEDMIPTRMAGEVQRVIRDAANCRDPFEGVKQKEMELARALSGDSYPSPSAGLVELVKFAVRGNSIDFFVPIDTLREEIKKPVTFSVDDTLELGEMLEGMENKKILYLADNAGECYFDLPLYRRLESCGDVYYVVKESPVQNDLTVEDLERSGLAGSFSNVVTSGTDTPGLDLRLASPAFLSLFERADLIIAKGMGHYETLPETELPAPTFLLMKAKCRPIAQSLGVEVNSYIASRLG